MHILRTSRWAEVISYVADVKSQLCRALLRRLVVDETHVDFCRIDISTWRYFTRTNELADLPNFHSRAPHRRRLVFLKFRNGIKIIIQFGIKRWNHTALPLAHPFQREIAAMI